MSMMQLRCITCACVQVAHYVILHPSLGANGELFAAASKMFLMALCPCSPQIPNSAFTLTWLHAGSDITHILLKRLKYQYTGGRQIFI